MESCKKCNVLYLPSLDHKDRPWVECMKMMWHKDCLIRYCLNMLGHVFNDYDMELIRKFREVNNDIKALLEIVQLVLRFRMPILKQHTKIVMFLKSLESEMITKTEEGSGIVVRIGSSVAAKPQF